MDLNAGNRNVVFKAFQDEFAGIVFGDDAIQFEPAEWKPQAGNFAPDRGGLVKVERD
jgi:hypothetical protein